MPQVTHLHFPQIEKTAVMYVRTSNRYSEAVYGKEGGLTVLFRDGVFRLEKEDGGEGRKQVFRVQQLEKSENKLLWTPKVLH